MTEGLPIQGAQEVARRLHESIEALQSRQDVLKAQAIAVTEALAILKNKTFIQNSEAVASFQKLQEMLDEIQGQYLSVGELMMLDQNELNTIETKIIQFNGLIQRIIFWEHELTSRQKLLFVKETGIQEREMSGEKIPKHEKDSIQILAEELEHLKESYAVYVQFLMKLRSDLSAYNNNVGAKQ